MGFRLLSAHPRPVVYSPNQLVGSCRMDLCGSSHGSSKAKKTTAHLFRVRRSTCAMCSQA